MKLTPEQQKDVERLLPRAEAIAAHYAPGDDDIAGVALLALCEAVLLHAEIGLGDLGAFACSHVRNRVLNALRDNHLEPAGGLNDVPDGRGPDTAVLDNLPDADQEIARKYWQEGCPLACLSNATGLSRRAMIRRLQGIKERLARELNRA